MQGAGSPVRARPGLGDMAPDFTARSTMGPVRLSDRRGRWVLLFTHPADFTPVCTSEFIALAAAKPEFDAIGCEIVAHSIDSLPAHFAWIRSIETNTGRKIDFPVVEDIGLSIARAYGMIHDGSASTATVRGVFAIDPDGVIQAMQFYPMAVGRNVQELLRLVRALQAVRQTSVCTPEGWVPGDAVLKPIELAVEDADPTAESAGGDRDFWYMRPVT